jgi:glycosyltransferase involved in cell wall biosynthesis
MTPHHTKLTIIIPHYNVEKYIDCLYDTLFPQVTKEVEVLLIEDRATDNTKEKMQQYECKNDNPNIKFVYLEKNLGLSGARNYGVSLASGEYVWFIDSDDTITKDAIDKILSAINIIHADGLVFDFFWPQGKMDHCDDDKQRNVFKLTQSKIRSLKHNTINTRNLLTALFNDAQMYVWCYILKKKFWEQFPFPSGRNFEDVATMPKIMYKIETLYYLPQPLLYYRQRENSILSNPTADSCIQMGQSMHEIGLYLLSQNLSKKEKLALFTFYVKMLRWSYEDLSNHNLLTKNALARYEEQETYFLNILPWNKYKFIRQIEGYTVFKVSSLLFFYNKKLYIFLKNIVGYIRS